MRLYTYTTTRGILVCDDIARRCRKKSLIESGTGIGVGQVNQGRMGLSKIADAMSGESEYDCPSCEQTLALESFGEYECPYCHHKFPYGIDELRIGGPLWKDRSLRNRRIASILSTGAGFVGAIIILIGIVLPPFAGIAVMIFIPYVVIVPRVLENKGMISSDWRRGESDGTSGGGSGGG